MKIFVSKSFDIADRDINSYFERLMLAAELDIATAEDYTGESIPQRVERILSECDFLVGIYVLRYEDQEKNKIVTSQWIMRETFTAHGQGKQFIALVEDGVSDTGGLNIDKELTAPVKQFRDEVKEVKKVIDDGIDFINEQVQAFVQKQKDARKLEIESTEEWQAIKECVPFNEDWLLKKWSDKALQILFTDTKAEIDRNIKSIQSMADLHKLDSYFYINKYKTQPIDEVMTRIAEDAKNIVKEEVTSSIGCGLYLLI